MTSLVRRAAQRTLLFVVALALVAAVWETYKALGPEEGGKLLGVSVLPRTSDYAMPHVWDMFSRFSRPEVRGSERTVLEAVTAGAWYSFRLSVAGFVLGALVGVGLAVLMARFKVVQRGVLPYLVVSQTVPLIALAPLVVSWGGRLEVGAFV